VTDDVLWFLRVVVVVVVVREERNAEEEDIKSANTKLIQAIVYALCSFLIIIYIISC